MLQARYEKDNNNQNQSVENQDILTGNIISISMKDNQVDEIELKGMASSFIHLYEDSLYQVKTLSCTCSQGNSTGSICTCDVPNIKDNIQLDTSEEVLPESAILCPGFLRGQFCDCSGDCTHNEAWCSCDAAKAQTCCNTAR